ncbi:MAG TPA: hypothetical protein DDX99_04895 [Desulfofustis sp.]|jgi:predicted nucleic-acid-binding protein|nr:hypothetical protein [Desulfofustis sp.]
MKGVDTTIFVRFLVGDDEQQAVSLQQHIPCASILSENYHFSIFHVALLSCMQYCCTLWAVLCSWIVCALI